MIKGLPSNGTERLRSLYLGWLKSNPAHKRALLGASDTVADAQIADALMNLTRVGVVMPYFYDAGDEVMGGFLIEGATQGEFERSMGMFLEAAPKKEEEGEDAGR